MSGQTRKNTTTKLLLKNCLIANQSSLSIYFLKRRLFHDVTLQVVAAAEPVPGN
jgi:hypothetical protein